MNDPKVIEDGFDVGRETTTKISSILLRATSTEWPAVSLPSPDRRERAPSRSDSGSRLLVTGAVGWPAGWSRVSLRRAPASRRRPDSSSARSRLVCAVAAMVMSRRASSNTRSASRSPPLQSPGNDQVGGLPGARLPLRTRPAVRMQVQKIFHISVHCMIR